MPRRYRTAISRVKRALLLLPWLYACESPVALPSGCVRDASRARRVIDTLAGIADGEVLLRSDTAGQICFGSGPGTYLPGPLFSLPSDTSDEEAAARLVHLLHHARHGRGLVAGERVPANEDCDALVDEALREEAIAHVLEMQVRESLGVTPARPFVNEASVLALPRDARADAVLAHLRDHPEGGGGYEPLGRDYRERCGR